MRISTTQVFQQGLSAMLEQQSKLMETQQQLATGRRILTPADDPAGSARSLDLSQAVAVTKQFQGNANAAKERLGVEDTTLSSLTDLLQRVRSELAVQANNATQSNETRAAISLEVQQRLKDLLALANTRDATNEYLFSGYKGQVQPFANTNGVYSYAGDQGNRYLQIGPTTQVATGDSGSDVFMAIRNGNGTFSMASNAANTGGGVLGAGTLSGTTAYVPGTYSLIMGQQTAVTGGALSFTDTGTVDTLGYQLRINGTLVYSGANPSSQTPAQIAASIAAQSGTTGVTAYVNSGVMYLANTVPSATPITVNEKLTGASDLTDTVTGYFGSALTGPSAGATSSNTITYNAPATGYVVLDSTNAVVAGGAYQGGASISFNGMQTTVDGAPNNGDRFTISQSANQDIFSTLQNLVNALAINGSSQAGQARINNEIGRSLADIDQAIGNVLNVRARVGARLNTIDSQQNTNDAASLQYQESLSNIQDLDYAEAASRLNLQQTILQAAQQAFIKVQGLSLFNYLR
jgi:flagellar hook-associated protein 3 FlgL